MNKYWSNITNQIEPYVCGEQPQDKKYIKLNTNESPYGPSPKVIEAINKCTNDDLRLYPDPNCQRLKSAAAKYYNLKADQIFVGNGSDEVLAFSFLAFFNPDNPIIFPDISYSFYPVYGELYNINYKQIPLSEDFSITPEDYSCENGGVVIPNPNAPTGRYLEIKEIKKILDSNIEKVVIIDEAYIDFGGESAVSIVNDYPNLLVIQTMSKSRCLAGMRIGIAMGQKHLIDALERIKNSFNSYTVDRLAAAAGEAALLDKQYLKECTSKIINTRENVINQLKELDFDIIPSKTNFIFAKHRKVSGNELFMKLKEKAVLVRHFNKPRIKDYLRITIGSDHDMKMVIERLKEILS
ncbi:histidinol-phosphate transaminase [Clostridium oryzae]|uniref:Histidinol-phosphate aminotransferase n=1 Tax=Clostridium oryzae TaxID=1450648 RepID=A0A1V4INU7_9CLOT|nr:histidinol-phosphate transaminase [Clostridium oryzae]OPJ61539.1 histidinol-phosphate aminotransferase [Clostridium oryzae]